MREGGREGREGGREGREGREGGREGMEGGERNGKVKVKGRGAYLSELMEGQFMLGVVAGGGCLSLLSCFFSLFITCNTSINSPILKHNHTHTHLHTIHIMHTHTHTNTRGAPVCVASYVREGSCLVDKSREVVKQIHGQEGVLQSTNQMSKSDSNKRASYSRIPCLVLSQQNSIC